MPQDFVFPPAGSGRFPAGDLWVFGYGSLIWRPGFDFVEKRLVRIFGFHRSLCISSHRYRGTPERPGLVLGLDRGGCCWGLAMRTPAAAAEATLTYLWEREMSTRVYRPVELAAYGTDGRPATAVLAFVARRPHPQYCGGLADGDMAARVAACRGESGANLDYLAETVTHLQALGTPDRRLARVLRLATARAAC